MGGGARRHPPDDEPTSTPGKKPAQAKTLEIEASDYPKHLAGRVYGVVVHGDVAGIEMPAS